MMLCCRCITICHMSNTNKFEGLHLLKESIQGKTYKAIWAMPNGSKTACILLDDYTVKDYPVRVNVTGMTGFAA